MTIDLKQDRSGVVVYLDNQPAFLIEANGKKEPISPTGWSMYRNNTRDIDEWLATRGKKKASPSGQIF